MKTRYRISREPSPSIEELKDYKDFGGLRHEYDRMTEPLYRRPLYKDPRSFVVLLIILLVAYLISVVDENGRHKENGTAPVELVPQGDEVDP